MSEIRRASLTILENRLVIVLLDLATRKVSYKVSGWVSETKPKIVHRFIKKTYTVPCHRYVTRNEPSTQSPPITLGTSSHRTDVMTMSAFVTCEYFDGKGGTLDIFFHVPKSDISSCSPYHTWDIVPESKCPTFHMLADELVAVIIRSA